MAINQNRISEKGITELQNTIKIFQKTIANTMLSGDEASGLLEIITKYTNSWLLLQKYDENSLNDDGKIKGIHYKLEAQEAYDSLLELKNNLIEK